MDSYECGGGLVGGNDGHLVHSSYSSYDFDSMDKTARGIIRRIIMYRHKGWENPYTLKDLVAKPKGNPIDMSNVPEMIAFETGADAMLEGLIKEGLYNDAVYGFNGEVPRRGHLVFIPEEGGI
ncbi:hypothetical protein LCGC14_2239260 [marine sediment metagenome]|uniref:Uncharacterized protein n=1 Tax=marine sediment metagenome TaxID=412755 RepID=A0A0F9D5M8_9ZZZZ